MCVLPGVSTLIFWALHSKTPGSWPIALHPQPLLHVSQWLGKLDAVLEQDLYRPPVGADQSITLPYLLPGARKGLRLHPHLLHLQYTACCCSLVFQEKLPEAMV